VTYRIEYKLDLTDTTWTLLTEKTAGGASESVLDPTTDLRRFYRVTAP
jgi:hypothetical protein